MAFFFWYKIIKPTSMSIYYCKGFRTALKSDVYNIHSIYLLYVGSVQAYLTIRVELKYVISKLLKTFQNSLLNDSKQNG